MTDKLVVNIKIKEGSLLDHLNNMSGVRVSFLLELDSRAASFFYTSERSFEANLENIDRQANTLVLRTLVNGKISASNNFPLPLPVKQIANL